jgi:hypothetical protein
MDARAPVPLGLAVGLSLETPGMTMPPPCPETATAAPSPPLPPAGSSLLISAVRNPLGLPPPPSGGLSGPSVE